MRRGTRTKGSGAESSWAEPPAAHTAGSGTWPGDNALHHPSSPQVCEKQVAAERWKGEGPAHHPGSRARGRGLRAADGQGEGEKTLTFSPAWKLSGSGSARVQT